MKSTKKIFISHSGKDPKLIKVYRSYFDRTGVKPIFMEYEKWSQSKDEANWELINRYIKSSEAVFAILSRNVVDHPQTQNWVAYEIGVASACEPPKPVWVFREEQIKFPVPYLNHYMPYSMDLNKNYEWWSKEYELIFKKHYSTVMKSIIEESRNYTKTTKVQCSNCKIIFCYHGTDYEFDCPCCSKSINALKQIVK